MKAFSARTGTGLLPSMAQRIAVLTFQTVSRGQKRRVKLSARVLGAVLLTGNLLLIITVLAFSGCTIRQQSTVPRTIVSTQASFSGNVQNSGLIGSDGKGGFIVDAHFIARWDSLTAKYGNRFTPVIKSGDRRGIEERVDSFSVTAETMANFRIMNFWRRAEQSGP